MNVSHAQQRIIDQDVRQYEGEVEYCQWQLARCMPAMEPYWKERGEYAQRVLTALVDYRTKLQPASSREPVERPASA